MLRWWVFGTLAGFQLAPAMIIGHATLAADLGAGKAALPPVTVVLVDQNYEQLWPCWAQTMADVNRELPLSIVPMDSTSAQFVKSWILTHPGVLDVTLDESYLVSAAQKGSSLHKGRWPPDVYSRIIWQAIQARLHEGHEAVLHSDLDALVMRDPWEMLANAGDEDIVIAADSYPSGYPHGAFNTGFALYRNTTGARQLVDGLVKIWDAGTQPKDKHQLNDQWMFTDFLNNLTCTAGESRRWPVTNGFHRGACGPVKLAVFTTQVLRGSLPCQTFDACKGMMPKATVVHQRGPVLLDKCGDAAAGPIAHP
mmetsp:Transcript_89153/g.260635  ORF Transcript_89153/g.260635 Transcript_89153/m.260635 type:complete len:310 (+) Transcript_89153:54-983(+)